MPQQNTFAQLEVLPGDTIANTAMETAFASKYLIPAGALSLGQILRINSGGTYNTPAVASRVLSMGLYLAGGVTTLGAAGRPPLTPSAVAYPWVLRSELIVTAEGVNGRLEGTCFIHMGNFTVSDDIWCSAIVAPQPIDTTIANLLEIRVAYNVADPANSITQRCLTVSVSP